MIKADIIKELETLERRRQESVNALRILNMQLQNELHKLSKIKSRQNEIFEKLKKDS